MRHKACLQFRVIHIYNADKPCQNGIQMCNTSNNVIFGLEVAKKVCDVP